MPQVDQDGWRREVARCIACSPRPVHFVGIGNELRRDDAAGLNVVSALGRVLGALPPPWVRLHPGEPPERVLSRIPREDGVVVIDAVQANVGPGGIVCATLDDTRYGFFATHNVPLRLIPGLTERQDTAYVIGIEPESLEVGEGLTLKVRRSVDALAAEIARQVRAWP
jgi:hydrogenase maturation protease